VRLKDPQDSTKYKKSSRKRWLHITVIKFTLKANQQNSFPYHFNKTQKFTIEIQTKTTLFRLQKNSWTITGTIG